MGKVTVSDILEQPGGWRFSVRILIFVGLAMVFDGFDYMIVSFTMPQITPEMSRAAWPPSACWACSSAGSSRGIWPIASAAST